jgi:hypothetical protein
MSKGIYFFYKGTPYKKDSWSNDELEISGKSLWDNTWSSKISKSKVTLCEEDEIENIYIENCKEALKLSLIGWTKDTAKELEEKGKKYLTERWKYYLLDCPNKVFKSCQEGKYGIMYRLSTIELPDELKIGNKPCSDGQTRSEKEYIKFLLGEDWSLIRLFVEKWPMLKFRYVDFSKSEDSFPDLYCMVPFYDDPKVLAEIQSSVLL